MLAMLEALNPELIAGGLVGLTMIGVVIRNVVLGWYEARGKMKDSERSLAPLTTAMSLTWDRNQIERVIQILENISESLAMNAKHIELVAKAQGIMSDNFQQTTQQKLDALLEEIKHAERRQRPHR